MKWILNKIFKEVVDGVAIKIGDLAKHVADARDFRYSMLGGIFDYKPKHTEAWTLPITSVKAQHPNNTCVFHSYASCREVTEGVELSPRATVAYAKRAGLLKSDGISSIRNGQEAGRSFGVVEETVCPNSNLNWSDYSGIQLTDDIQANAASHRAKSYFWVKTKNEWLKALDDGHAIHTGFDWYSSYNMSSGFSAPWILTWRKGYKVGGHAICIKGYDPKRELYIAHNSFGRTWGNSGTFYIRMSDIHREGIEGAVALDLDGQTLDAFISSHEGMSVKKDGDPAIYRIQDGKKRPFLDVITFYAWGGRFPDDGEQNYKDVAGSFLDKVELGDPMTVEESIFWPKLQDYWNEIKWMHYPDNISTIKSLIQQ